MDSAVKHLANLKNQMINVNGCETTAPASWYDPVADSRWPGFLRQMGDWVKLEFSRLPGVVGSFQVLGIGKQPHVICAKSVVNQMSKILS